MWFSGLKWFIGGYKLFIWFRGLVETSQLSLQPQHYFAGTWEQCGLQRFKCGSFRGQGRGVVDGAAMLDAEADGKAAVV